MDVLLPGIVMVIMLHFVADFVMQTHEMATKKSSSNGWLLWHVVVYTMPFSLMFFIFEDIVLTLQFMLFNGAAHFFVDYVTSRVAKFYREKEMWHEFFVVIGVDQTTHYMALILSFVWFMGLWPVIGF